MVEIFPPEVALRLHLWYFCPIREHKPARKFSAELNQYLENIAKLIEATAKSPEDAAKIVRESKVKA